MSDLGAGRAEESLACLRRAIAGLPACLAHASTVPIPALARTPRSVVTTGIGASEGPARMLAATLVEAGVAARFCETSHFAFAAPSAELLVVFSQGLSPNARLALAHAPRFGARWLVTSVGMDAPTHAAASASASASASATATAAAEGADADARAVRDALALAAAHGVVPIVVPPAREDAMLVRLVGPTVAALVALRIAASLVDGHPLAERLAHAPDAYRPLEQPAALGGAPLALVTAGVTREAAHGHRWKLLEALLQDDPPIWDVLQVAHGPLQSFHGEPMQLIVLEHRMAAPLVERLATTLVEGRHRMLRLVSTHDDALSYFEHAATIDALLLATLEAHPRDLFEWPARGADGPLYGFGGT